jgi:hypothetical protein
MTEQPPQQPSGNPADRESATWRMPPAAGASPTNPPGPRTSNAWRQAISTRGGRWAVGIAAAALAALLLLGVGVGVAGVLVLRNHNVVATTGQQQSGSFRAPFGRGNGGNGNPGQPGARGGRLPGGLGGILGGTALHGNVTANVNGSPQSLVFQRGLVTAVSSTSITLQSSDGFTATYGRTVQTRTRAAVPGTGVQALVLARASNKVAITILAPQAMTGVARPARPTT